MEKASLKPQGPVTCPLASGRHEATGREDGIPAPILPQDHQALLWLPGCRDFPHGFTPTRAPALEGNGCCAHPAGRKERGQRGGAHAVPLAVVPLRVVPAAQALPGVGAAVVGVAVAVAGLAAGEAPEAGQAAVALPPVHPGEAVALARLRIAEGIVGASDVALACCKERERGAAFPWQAQNAGPRLQHSPEPRV